MNAPLSGMAWGVQMDSEKAIMLELARKKGLTIHATPCDGMRECGDLGDMSNSCHWSVTHRWMCFRCTKPCCASMPHPYSQMIALVLCLTALLQFGTADVPLFRHFLPILLFAHLLCLSISMSISYLCHHVDVGRCVA